jgi:hypothetical protein
MMLSAQIDDDCKSLRRYFEKLFEVLAQALKEDQSARLEPFDTMARESQATYFHISHFIKPDMLINIYGLVDFWLKKICDHQMKENRLSISYADIKGKDDLHACHRYLTKTVGLDLGSVASAYRRLQELRKVRNRFIHHGGHVPDDEKLSKQISKIKGIVFSGSLIVIDENFVWDVLNCAKKYLCTAAVG